MREIKIELAITDGAIRRCHPVMRQLRDRYSEDAFVEQVRKQFSNGYQLAFIGSADNVQAVAGFHLRESLSWGKFMHVDDLVSDEATRGQGYGGRLFDWLLARAREEGCAQLHLDSGVAKHGAHRFYLGKGMDISCHHFEIKLGPK